MDTFKKRYNCKVGYSGHDRGVIIPAIAAMRCAIAIEKHFTLDRAMRGPDHGSSIEQRGLNLAIKYIKSALKCLGSPEKNILEAELPKREKYCFSVKAKVDIKANEIFNEHNLIFKSPRNENARDYYELLGRKAKKNYKKDEDIL